MTTMFSDFRRPRFWPRSMSRAAHGDFPAGSISADVAVSRRDPAHGDLVPTRKVARRRGQENPNGARRADRGRLVRPGAHTGDYLCSWVLRSRLQNRVHHIRLPRVGTRSFAAILPHRARLRKFGDWRRRWRRQMSEFVSSKPPVPCMVGHGRGAVVGGSLSVLPRQAGFGAARFTSTYAGAQFDILARSASRVTRDPWGSERTHSEGVLSRE